MRNKLNRVVGFAGIFLSLSSAMFSEIDYLITYPPFEAEDEGAFVGEFHMNQIGTVVWVEELVLDPIQPRKITLNIARPVEGEYREDRIERITAPATPRSGTYKIVDLNNLDQFVIAESGGRGVRQMYFWNGGGFVPLHHPWDDPDNQSIIGFSFHLARGGVTAISDEGIVYGVVDDTSRDYSEMPVLSGYYAWDSSGIPAKISDLPNLVSTSRELGPNGMGTALYSTSGAAPNSFFYWPFGAQEAFSLPNQFVQYLNKKNQVFGSGWLYLPTEDYGLPEGTTLVETHALVPTDGNTLLRRSVGGAEAFEIYEDDAWKALTLIDPERPGFVTNIASRVYGLDNDGNILAGDVRPIDGVNTETVMLLKRNEFIRATVSVNAKQVALNEEFFFDVDIKNTSDQHFTLSGVYGESFRVLGSSSAGLQQLDNPAPTDSLAPGATFRQRFPWKSSEPGKIKFSFQAVGFFADGTANFTSTKFTDEIQVGGDPVKIEFETLPLVPKKPPDDLTEVSIVNMKVQEDPENPGQFIVTDNIPGEEVNSVITPKVKLKITNVWEKKTPVTASIQGLDTRKRDKTPLGTRAKIVGAFPIDLGTLAFGESIEREFPIDIRDDGRFDFSALVTSTPEGSTEQYNTRETGSPIAVGVPFPAKIEFKFDRGTSDITNNNGDGAFFLTPGGKLKVTASVENLTSNAKLNFFGIEAKKELNAFNANLTSEDGNANDPPFIHDHEVDPNAAVVLSAFVKNDPNGAPKGTVTWQLPEGAFLKDIESGDKTELIPDDFLIETEVGGWLGDDLAARIVQDNSRDPITDLTGGESAAYFSYGVLLGVSKWMDDNLDAIGGIGRVAGTVSADPSLLADKMGEGARAVWEAAEMVHLGWSSMTDAEKDAFILQVSDETWRRAQFLATAPFDKEKREAALEYTRGSTQFLFNGVTEAYASDDPARISQMYGQVTGNIAMEVATAYLPEPSFTRYFSGAEAANLAKATDNIRNPFNTQQTILRNVPSGPVTRELAVEGWGIGGKHLDDVQEALGDLGMKGYARERAPRSIELSETLDEAVLKPEPIKAKGFSDLDRLMFGDTLPQIPGKNGDLIDLDELTAVVFPPNNTVIRNRLRASGESDEVIEAVIARADFRRKEYSKRAPELNDLKRDGVDTGLNYKDNDAIGGPNQRPSVKREFDFETIEVPGGGTIHVPKMANKDGDLRFITGDVDWVHFSHLDGTPLTPSEAGKLYDYLAHCCGLKHPETVTWIKNGQSVFEGKVNQISEYLTGQKALLEVSGEGIRAARIRPNLTRFHPNQRSHLIFFDGGTKTLQKKLDDIVLQENFAFLFSKLPPKKAVIPLLWFAKSGVIEEDTTIDGQDWTYSKDTDAVLARELDDGVLERYDGKNWIPWDPKSDPNPNASSVTTFSNDSVVGLQVGEKLNLTPTIVLSDAAFAGDTVLQVADFAALWATELEGHLDAWFTVGDTIVIAPGTPQQEIRKIVSLAPFEIDQKIRYDHIEDTVVSFVPESMIANLNAIQEPRLLLDKPIVVEGIAVFEFEMPHGSQFVFQTSEDLENWMPITREALVGGLILEETVQLEYPGEPIFIIMDSGGNKSFLRWREASDTN